MASRAEIAASSAEGGAEQRIARRLGTARAARWTRRDSPAILFALETRSREPEPLLLP